MDKSCKKLVSDPKPFSDRAWVIVDVLAGEIVIASFHFASVQHLCRVLNVESVFDNQYQIVRFDKFVY